MTLSPATRPSELSATGALAVAGEFAAAIGPGVIERDQAGMVPYAELAAFDATGLLAITVPVEHGGPDLPSTVLAEVIRTIAAVDPAIAQVPQGHYLMVDVLALWGTARQQALLFDEVLAGGRLGNALSERGGRHAQDLHTRLSSHGRGLRLNGRKYYCTGAISSRWIGVSALNDTDRVVLAFVPRDAAGLTIDEDWDTMGQRATVSGTTILEDVDVDPELVVPYHQAFAVPQQLGARAQLVHAAIEVGIAAGALRDGRAYVRDRARPFFEAANAGWAASAGQDPYTIGRLGRLATKVQAAEQLLRWAAATQEEIGRQPADASAAARGSLAVAQAKAFGCEVAVEVSSELFAMAGASAADQRHDLSRHWRNARTHSSHDPVDWKYHHVGNFLLNDVLPPSHGQL
jgi:SfnB family sulfur acquisition oxidoreductase